MKKKNNFHISIVTVLVLFNICIVIFFAYIINTFNYDIILKNYLTEQYEAESKSLYNASNIFINADDFNYYLNNLKLDEYNKLKTNFDTLCDDEVSSIQVIIPNSDYNSYTIIFNSNNENNNSYKLGDVKEITLTDSYKEIMNGTKNEIYDNNNKYINALYPIKNSYQKIVAIMVIKRSLSPLNSEIKKIKYQLLILSVLLLFIVITFTHIFVYLKLVKPLKKLKNESNRFAKENTLIEYEIYKGYITEIKDTCDCVTNLEKSVIDYISKVSVIAKNNERITTELNVGSNIQKGFVPTLTPEIEKRKEFKLYGNMIPSKEVGGDFYDYFLVDDNTLGLVMGDVSGKGVPAALLMMTTKTLVKENAFYKNNPSKVLELTNNRICEVQRDYMFITLWFGILDLKTGVLTFANAGHCDPIISKNKKDFYEYQTAHDIPLGITSNFKYTDYKIKLDKNDKLFICTDGIFEAVNNKNEQFGIQNTIKALNKNIKENPKKVLDNLYEEINKFTDNKEQFDDITMLYIDYCKNDITNINKNYKADFKKISAIYNDFIPEIETKTNKEIANLYYTVFDEMLSNIIKYGYNKETIKDSIINIDLEIDPKNSKIILTITDNGCKFNPLSKKNPDISLSADEREIGGLGIHIVKSIMDEVKYNYTEGKNVLTITKKYISKEK